MSDSMMPDTFDRAIGLLDGLNDVTHTKPSTLTVVTPIIGAVQTHIVQTYRQNEVGDFIFLQVVDSTCSIRIVIPPKVADTIASQRDSISAKNRRKGARQAVETRKAKGITPGFLRPGARRGGRKKGA
jgi:hypothetical protein